MSGTEYFPAHSRGGGWEDYAVLVILASAAILAHIFLRERDRHRDGVYSPPLAWMRAALYFSVVLALSWLAGVVQVVLHSPLATADDVANPGWWSGLALCIAAVIWGYVVWWPRGTLTYDRKLYPVTQALFGLTWGSCSALLLLSLWAVVEEFGFSRWITFAVVLFFQSGFSQIYQSGWWDIHVSPPHNIRAWNARKVLFGHLPFMLVTLSHFALFGDAAVFVLLFAAAMACSVIAMRFPPFWEKDGPLVSKQTAIGV